AASATCRHAVFILLLGAPGSGKGTQGKILAHRLGLPKITTGDILRAAVKGETPLGREAKKYMDAGSLVPDSVILGMIKEELAKPEAQQGAVFDGFPRTAVQAELVDRTLAERGQRLNHILLLDVPEEELVRRTTGRDARARAAPRPPRRVHGGARPPRGAIHPLAPGRPAFVQGIVRLPRHAVHLDQPRGGPWHPVVRTGAQGRRRLERRRGSVARRAARGLGGDVSRRRRERGCGTAAYHHADRPRGRCGAGARGQ